jgi:ABC-2 type transport system permease protein
MADIQYRANIFSKIISDMFWYAGQISVFEVLYHHIPNIAGWDLNQSRLLVASMFVSDAIYMIVFSESMERMSEKVIRGDLDLLLVKPVNSQFIMSCQKMSTAYSANLLITISYLIFVFVKTHHSFPIQNFITGFILLFFSSLVAYSFRIFFAMMAINFSRVDSLNYIWFQFYRFGMRPDSVYPRSLRTIFLTFLPLAYLASVPARLFYGAGNWLQFAGGIIFPLLFLYAVCKTWNRVIKNYSSASS